MAADYIGNCAHLIDFDNLVKKLKSKKYDRISPTVNTKIDKSILDAGYKPYYKNGSAKWKMYFAEESYDQKIIDIIVKFSNISNYNTSWISRVDPGFCVPPHVDEMKALIDVNRIHVFIEDSIMGHVFYIENQYFSNYKKGDIFLWKNPYSIHAACNISTKAKFLLNIY